MTKFYHIIIVYFYRKINFFVTKNPTKKIVSVLELNVTHLSESATINRIGYNSRRLCRQHASLAEQTRERAYPQTS